MRRMVATPQRLVIELHKLKAFPAPKPRDFRSTPFARSNLLFDMQLEPSLLKPNETSARTRCRIFVNRNKHADRFRCRQARQALEGPLFLLRHFAGGR